VRISIEIPRDLHRRLRAAAERKGCSVRKLVLASMERAVEEDRLAMPARRLSLDQPLIRPAGRRIDLAEEKIYELIQLP
jgi:hypothetical protein